MFVFKVKTDVGVVGTSEEISRPRGNVEKVGVKFAPTKTLTVITEPGGKNYELTGPRGSCRKVVARHFTSFTP